MKIMLLRLHLTKWAIIIIANLFRIEICACIPSGRFSQTKAESVRNVNSTHVAAFSKENDAILDSRWNNGEFTRVSENLKSHVKSESNPLLRRKSRKDMLYQQGKRHRLYTGELRQPVFMTKIGTAVFKIPFEEISPAQGTYAKFIPTAQPQLDDLDIETIPPYLDIPFPDRKKRQVQDPSAVNASALTYPNVEIPKNSNLASQSRFSTLKDDSEKYKDIEHKDATNIPSPMADYTFYKILPFSQKDYENKINFFLSIIRKPIYDFNYIANKVSTKIHENQNHEDPGTENGVERKGKSIFLLRNIPDKDKIQFKNTYPKKTGNFIKSLVEDAPWESLFMQMVKEVVSHFVDKTLDHLFSTHKDKRSINNLIQSSWSDFVSDQSPFNIVNTTTKESLNVFRIILERFMDTKNRDIKELENPPPSTMFPPNAGFLGNETLLKIIVNEIFDFTLQKIIKEYNNLIKNPEIAQLFQNPILNLAETLTDFRDRRNVSTSDSPLTNYESPDGEIRENTENNQFQNIKRNSYFVLRIKNKAKEESMSNSSKFHHQQQNMTNSLSSSIAQFLKSQPSSKNRNNYLGYLDSFNSPRESRVLFPFTDSWGEEKIHIKDPIGHKTIKFIRSLVEDAPWESMFMRMVRMVVDHFVEKTLEHLFAAHKDKRSLDYTSPYLSDIASFPQMFKNNKDAMKLHVMQLIDRIAEEFPTSDSPFQSPNQHYGERQKTTIVNDLKKIATKEFFNQDFFPEILIKLNSEIQNLPTQVSFDLLPVSDSKYENELFKTNYEILVHQPMPLTAKNLENKSKTLLQINDENLNLSQDSGAADISNTHLKSLLDNIFSKIQNQNTDSLKTKKLLWNLATYQVADDDQERNDNQKSNDDKAEILKLDRTKRSLASVIDPNFQKDMKNAIKFSETGKTRSKEFISDVLFQRSDEKQASGLSRRKTSTDTNYLSFLKNLIANIRNQIFQNSASANTNRVKRSINKLWYDEYEKPPNQKKFVDCSLRSACNAGRLLSRLPSVHEITMQLRTPEDDEPHWDALLWGMKKRRCTHLTCKRYRAPKGSRYYKKRVIKKGYLPLSTTSVSESLSGFGSAYSNLR